MKCGRLFADRLGEFGKLCQPVLQGAEIEPGPADDDRQSPFGRRRRDFGQGERAPAAGRAALGGIEKAVEPVWCPRLRGGIGPRRQDCEIAIALQRVGIDDGPAQLLRQRQRQR